MGEKLVGVVISTMDETQLRQALFALNALVANGYEGGYWLHSDEWESIISEAVTDD